MFSADGDLADGDLADGDLATGELGFVAAQLGAAARPEDVFGVLAGAQPEQVARLRQQYRRLALAVHPDRHGNDPRANAAFVALQRLYSTALEQIAQARYGRQAAPADAVVITTRRREYTVGAKLAEGDLADLYTCLVTEGGQQGGGRQSAGILKIARDAEDNDLLMNEALSLRHLLADVGTEPVPAYIPRMLESFLYEDGDGVQRQINAFPLAMTERGPLPSDELFSLREVRERYRSGVDPRHMAWIWRRLLIALGHAHDRAVIHGAVLPTHILIHPESHALLLIDWCQSVYQPGSSGTHIPALSPEYERWYPPSVLAKAVPTPAIDLTMALRCMVSLLGGDPLGGTMPATVPPPIRAYLDGALATAGQTSAWQLYRRFSDLMQTLWGQRTFVPFSMPARQRGGPAR